MTRTLRRTSEGPVPGRPVGTWLAMATAAVLAGIVLAADEPPIGPVLDDDVRALAAKVLVNPNDARLKRELSDLRQRQRRERAEALDALAAGLEAHLDGPRSAAPENLRKALRSPYATALADAILMRPLAELARQYGAAGPQPHASGRSASAVPQAPCPRCGGTGWLDCPSPICAASGWQPCAACRGIGSISPERAAGGVLRICQHCRGLGAEKCDRCGGRGTVPCPACGGTAPATPSPPSYLGPAEVESIRQTIAMARYLRSGGLDLYWPGALAVSPKVDPPVSPPSSILR